MLRYVDIEPKPATGNDSRHPFWREPHRRPLTVFVDPRLLVEPRGTDDTTDTFLTVVEHLSGNPLVELMTLERDDSRYQGRIEQLSLEKKDGDIIARRGSQSILLRSESDYQNRADIASKRLPASAEKWHEAFILLDVAERVDADLLVTKRADTLFSREPMISPIGLIITTAEALALLGLLCREHQQWFDFIPPSVVTTPDEWLARRIAVQAVLDDKSLAHLGVVSAQPEGSDWISRQDSLIRRMTTAVAIRDVICAQSLMSTSPAGRGERISAHLEWLTLTISGAFDSLALVVNDKLGYCAQDKRSVSWNNDNWRKIAGSHYRDLVDAVNAKQVIPYVRFCQYLRNTIHDIGPAAFTGVRLMTGAITPGVRPSAQPLPRKRLYVRIPEEVAAKVKAHLTGLGSSAATALANDFDGTNLDPFIVADVLVDVGLDRLNQLLLAMPWKEFGSDGTKLPPPGTAEIYGPASEQFVKACYGLGVKSNRPSLGPKPAFDPPIEDLLRGSAPAPSVVPSPAPGALGVEPPATRLGSPTPDPEPAQAADEQGQ